jgi:hypothetical protein
MRFLLLSLLIFCQLGFLKVAADSNIYLSSSSFGVADDKAYLIEKDSNDNMLLSSYSFPALELQEQIVLDSNFSYANANSAGVLVYNYSNTLVDKGSEVSTLPSKNYFSEVYEIKSYDNGLNLVATKTIENQYYYDFLPFVKEGDNSLSTDKNVDGIVSLADSGKCDGKKKAKKDDKCGKVVFKTRIK